MCVLKNYIFIFWMRGEKKRHHLIKKGKICQGKETVETDGTQSVLIGNGNYDVNNKSQNKCLELPMITLFTIALVLTIFYLMLNVFLPWIDRSFLSRLEKTDTTCVCNCSESPPSLAYGENGLLDIDHQRLFYNRVPKCGSTTLITLIRKLANLNGFKHFNSKIYDKKIIDVVDQNRFASKVATTLSPCSFDRHVFFINFTRFAKQSPMYINIIREPVERIISSYFYRRMVAKQTKNGSKPSNHWLNKKFEQCVLTSDIECAFIDGENYSVLQLPYFCGQESYCSLLNDQRAIQQAKGNIEKYYIVVGTLEEMNLTIEVLEATMPQFFNGAVKVFKALGPHRNQNLNKEQIKENVKETLKANLSGEYELYNFVKQRLYKQHKTAVKEKTNDEMSTLIELTNYY